MNNNGNGRVEYIASAQLPTRFGDFTIKGYLETETGKEHLALIHGDVFEKEECPVRIHSQCHTGDIFGSLRCDCREQLEAALEYISRQDYGCILYLSQEGRGIGILNKVKAYHLQDLGLDTVEANRSLGFPTDIRDYTVAAHMIHHLGIRSIALLTNNPLKISGLEDHDIIITKRIPLEIMPNPHNRNYLHTKRTRMGHLIGELFP